MNSDRAHVYQVHQLGCGVNFLTRSLWLSLRCILVALLIIGINGFNYTASAAPKPATDRSMDLRRDGGKRSATDDERLWLPLVSDTVYIKADTVHHWQDKNRNRFLHLNGNVKYSVGRFNFKSNDAILRIKRKTFGQQQRTQVWLYMAEANQGRIEGLFKRGLEAESKSIMRSRHLLTTAVTTGPIKLTAGQMIPHISTLNQSLLQDAFRRFSLREKKLNDLDFNQDPALTLAGQMEKKKALKQKIQAQKKYMQTTDAHLALQKTWQMVDEQTRRQRHITESAELPSNQSVEQEGSLDTRVIPQDAKLSFFARKDPQILLPDEEREGSILLERDVSLFVISNQNGKSRTISLHCDGAVIFLSGKRLSRDQSADRLIGRTIDAGMVTGIYLEGDVTISDGDTKLRTRKVYYDLIKDRALLLDAVVFTHRTTKFGQQLPLYLRAKEIAQFSRSELVARHARLSTSEFFTPSIAIGASTIALNAQLGLSATLTKKTESNTQPLSPQTEIAAKDLTLRANNIPFAYWPFIRTRLNQFPLERISSTYRGDTGLEIKTRWDVNQLAKLNLPEGTTLKLDMDILGLHGAAYGLELDYEQTDAIGNAFGYVLPMDSGEDRIPGRNPVTHDKEFRGVLSARHKHTLDEDWELSLELGVISDPTFLEEIFPDLATNEKPFETSFYLKRQSEETALSLLVKTDINDFTSNTTIFQNPGYAVDKLPEIAYFQIGTPLLGERITYYAENRYSNARLDFGGESASDHGFSNAQSLGLLGIPNTTIFDQAAQQVGFPIDTVNRFDSRHEIQAPLMVGDFNVTPFASGVVSAIEGDFQRFAGNNDQLRFTGTIGINGGTQFSRVYPNFHLPLFDAWQLRHILEPNLHASTTDTSIEPGLWPVFYDEYDGFTEGGTARAGLKQTFQTKRGGTGRWRHVDWLVMETDIVHRSDKRDNFRLVPDFNEYRPELSRGGDFASAKASWQATQHMAISADSVYSLENDQFDQWSSQLEIDHGDGFATFYNYSALQLTPSNFMNHQFAYGFQFDLTAKYAMAARHTIDLTREHNSDQVATTLRRRMHRFTVDLGVKYDRIDEETTVSLVVIPDGLKLKNLLR